MDAVSANPNQQTLSANVANMDETFKMGCHRDLRASVARMRLYLEDDRTVLVLL